ncbi:hypothetical protein GJV85_02230 [Sulfurimonas aquatica]|uniref:Cytochrome c domain-containing protein n=1 Tax=Sulfurimonas aquatica TaxID=2672570 RepID=A0A975AYT6_9BACT|nr:hypothetical protein [Sulfurimonas aquatica]QSZ40980.1 hypothetical protein GJV85_02230 [Sulfurimonas aquatica]
MRGLYLTSFIVATLVLSGCGGSSDSSSESNEATQSSSTITVERGPILGATVVDSEGKVAKEDANGRYIFTPAPLYPIIVSGGVIDMDRDGSISIGDVKNDYKLSTTSGSVVTMATTMAVNPATKLKLETLASSFGLSLDDVMSKTPTESKEIEAISNILYKYAKDNNISDLLDSSDEKILNFDIAAITLDIKETFDAYEAEGDEHDSKETEEELMNAIAYGVSILDSDGVSEALSGFGEIDDDLVQSLSQELLVMKSEYESEYGDLDYEESDGDDYVHNQGLDCMACHGTNPTALFESEDEDDESDDHDDENENESEENDEQFTSGATIYRTLNAANGVTNVASGYSLRLVLENTNAVINYRLGQGNGNVNATFDEGTVNSYTAHVIDPEGNIVNSSLSNSHDLSRLACNSCHTSAGANGAPGRIVSFNYSTPEAEVQTPVVTPEVNSTTETTPTTTVVKKSFANDVMPIFEAKCKICHGNSGNFSVTTAAVTYMSINAFGGTNIATPTSSSILTKATGVAHDGGVIFSNTSAEYATIRDWIFEGALNN